MMGQSMGYLVVIMVIYCYVQFQGFSMEFIIIKMRNLIKFNIDIMYCIQKRYV